MGRPDRIQVNAPAISQDDQRAVARVLDSGWIGTGPECAAFESELATFLGAEHVVCVSSCTAALELMFDHVGVCSGGRVAVPAWTYVATALPAVHRGAEIVLVDVDPSTLALDSHSLERALSTGIDVVVPVHFAGVPVPRRVWDLCDAYGARVIEDAAHAFGASDELGPIRGLRSVGSAFSFHATKNLTCGEGGAVATTDAALASTLRRTRLHGLDLDSWQRETTGTWSMGDVSSPGRKANLPDVLAALGRSQLATFGERQRLRRSLLEQYRHGLGAVDGLEFVPATAHPGSADHLAVVVIPVDVERQPLIDALADRGISTGLHFKPLHRMSWFASHATIAPGGLPVCDSVAERALSLPLHPRMNVDLVDEVCDAIVRHVRAVRHEL